MGKGPLVHFGDEKGVRKALRGGFPQGPAFLPPLLSARSLMLCFDCWIRFCSLGGNKSNKAMLHARCCSLRVQSISRAKAGKSSLPHFIPPQKAASTLGLTTASSCTCASPSATFQLVATPWRLGRQAEGQRKHGRFANVRWGRGLQTRGSPLSTQQQGGHRVPPKGPSFVDNPSHACWQCGSRRRSSQHL